MGTQHEGVLPRCKYCGKGPHGHNNPDHSFVPEMPVTLPRCAHCGAGPHGQRPDHTYTPESVPTLNGRPLTAPERPVCRTPLPLGVMPGDECPQCSHMACMHDREGCVFCLLASVRDELQKMLTPGYWRQQARINGVEWPL